MILYAGDTGKKGLARGHPTDHGESRTRAPCTCVPDGHAAPRGCRSTVGNEVSPFPRASRWSFWKAVVSARRDGGAQRCVTALRPASEIAGLQQESSAHPGLCLLGPRNLTGVILI